MTKRSVTVEVAGQKLTLKTEADEAYVKSLARLVTEKIDEAKASSRSVSTQALAVLAALNLADELLQTKRGTSELKRKVREKTRTLLEMFEKEAKL